MRNSKYHILFLLVCLLSSCTTIKDYEIGDSGFYLIHEEKHENKSISIIMCHNNIDKINNVTLTVSVVTNVLIEEIEELIIIVDGEYLFFKEQVINSGPMIGSDGFMLGVSINIGIEIINRMNSSKELIISVNKIKLTISEKEKNIIKMIGNNDPAP